MLSTRAREVFFLLQWVVVNVEFYNYSKCGDQVTAGASYKWDIVYQRPCFKVQGTLQKVERTEELGNGEERSETLASGYDRMWPLYS